MKDFMNAPLQLDLSRFPMKVIFAGVVVILAIISIRSPRHHITELNLLPRNRTELDSIKVVELKLVDGLIQASVTIECIFPVTYDQTYRFFHLDFSASGINVSMNKSHVTGMGRDGDTLRMTFTPPLYGHVRADLYRSRSLLASQIFDIPESDPDGSSAFSVLETDEDMRLVNFTNVCWALDHFIYFSRCIWSLRFPFLYFAGSATISGMKANTDKLLDSYDSIIEGRSVVIAFPQFSPFDWNWIQNTAAPIVSLQNEFDTVIALHGDANISYFSDFGVIIAVSEEPVCVERSEVNYLKYSPESTEFFRDQVMSLKGAVKMTKKVVILLSNFGTFNVTNIRNISEAICPNCKIQEIMGERLKFDALVKALSSAKFVLMPYSSMLSQALWIRGVLIELIPEGSECRNWTFDVSNAAGIRHLRFSIGNETRISDFSGTEQCEYGFEAGLSSLASADVELIAEAVNNRE
jgi:hypothetical protein